jgi:HEAT repeat protein
VRLRSSLLERRAGTALRLCLNLRLERLVKRGALKRPLPDLSAGPSLQALASDRRALVRRVVAQCASESNTLTAKSLLLRLASDTSAEVRVAAIEGLGSLLDGQDCPRSLLGHLQDRSLLVRISTVTALGQIGDKRAIGQLRAALRDSSPLVRSYAAAAVGRLGKSAVREELNTLADLERSATAKVGFLDGLHAAGDTPKAVEGLLRLVASRDYRVRCAAANTLASLRLRSPLRAEVRGAVRRALRAETTTAGREALQRAVWSVRTSGGRHGSGRGHV